VPRLRQHPTHGSLPCEESRLAYLRRSLHPAPV